MENTSNKATETKDTTCERRIYKREGFTHITCGSVYFAPAFNVTNAKIGARVLCTRKGDFLLVDAGGAKPEKWLPIAKEALGKPVRKVAPKEESAPKGE